MREVYIEVPELPTVSKYVLLDRPGIIYINLSCKSKGIILIIASESNDRLSSPAPDSAGSLRYAWASDFLSSTLF